MEFRCRCVANFHAQTFRCEVGFCFSGGERKITIWKNNMKLNCHMRKDIWAVCGGVRESESVTKICESQKSFVRLCKLKRVLREKKSRSRAENICVWGARCTSRSERIWAIEEAVEPHRWPSSIFVHSSCACIRAESSLLSLALSLAWVCFTRYRSKLEPFRERISS